jgi:2-oxoglutarate dehydrogenase E2 component (dihydrolipoamide succinyltransferase)
LVLNYQSTTSGNFSLGAIRKMPAVIETLKETLLESPEKMFLSHSYDHRVVDGALGGSFVKESLNT